MTWFYYKLLFISLGVSVGLFLAYQAYKYYLSTRKVNHVHLPKIILHNLEHRHNSGEIVFHFEIDSNQKVILEICDLNFETIFTIFEKELTSGAHTQIFETSKVPKGVYFYRLKGEQQQVMKKFAINNEFN